MAIPKYDQITKPALGMLTEKSPKPVAELVDALADYFKLSEEERSRLLPSGRDRLFRNRARWALFYLRHALLVDTDKRGVYKITDRGRKVAQESPQKIDKQYLKRFPEFALFIGQKGEEEPTAAEASGNGSTPEEELEAIFADLQSDLRVEILEQIKAMSPSFFESLVVDLLVKMGYGGSRTDAGQAIGRSGDGGIDGTIKEDKLGLDVIYVQAKRWEGKVGRPTVQAFAGSLEGVRANRGIIISTSDFTADAKDYVKQIEKKIVLIDGEMLSQLMIDHDLGVSTIASYQLKKIDTDYFSED